MDSSQKKIKIAVEKKQLSESSYENLKEFIENKEMPSWIVESIDFLINNSHWEELNDRFHRTLAFGTGGMRGRTIGKLITDAEMGNAQKMKHQRMQPSAVIL